MQLHSLDGCRAGLTCSSSSFLLRPSILMVLMQSCQCRHTEEMKHFTFSHFKTWCINYEDKRQKNEAMLHMDNSLALYWTITPFINALIVHFIHTHTHVFDLIYCMICIIFENHVINSTIDILITMFILIIITNTTICYFTDGSIALLLLIFCFCISLFATNILCYIILYSIA